MHNKSLYEAVHEGLNVAIDSADFVYVYAESLLYLAGATSAFEYQEYIKPYCSAMSAKVFRLSLQDSKYTNLDLKLFALRVGQHTSITRAEVLRIARRYSIDRNDALMVNALYQECPWVRRLLRQCGRKVKRDNPYFEFRSIEELFNTVYPSVLKYIKFIAYKKLRFIVKADNEGFEDLYSELSAKMIQAFYSMMPVQATELHVTNYLKRVIHNHVVNMIKSRTSKKRGRIVNVGKDRNNDNQFSLICVSQNQVAAKLDEDGNQIDITNVASDVNARFEQQFTISQVLNSVKASKKKYRFITLLLGVEDEAFTEWLKSEGLCKPSEDNVDVQARTPATEFNGLVAEFLKVPVSKAESFLERLRDMVEV